ncbi:MAG: hypothetical protein DWI62_04785 [Chloroflexi bacterium]|nr:MAG: hypothetical protein DWI62_04785 [Chloroflexota bacterium]
MRQVPANRAGHRLFSVAHPRTVQAVASLKMFVPLAGFCRREKPPLNYLDAGACRFSAIFFMFCAPAH